MRSPSADRGTIVRAASERAPICLLGRHRQESRKRRATGADHEDRRISPFVVSLSNHGRTHTACPGTSVRGELVEPWTDAHRMPGPVPAALRQAQGERPLIEYFFSGLERDVDRHFLDERLQRNTELIVRN